MLEISRLESGKIHIEESKCSLMELTHQVQMKMLQRAAVNNLTISLDISNLSHDNVKADKEKVRQILTYLVDNAVKYTPKGGRISISIYEQPERKNDRVYYQFVVEDNGIGIGELFLPHIFEPFEREKNTTMSGIHGTGLGLTITKCLVTLLGGTIEISSIVGEGSRFIVTIPLHIQEEPAVSDENDNTADLHKKAKRILIVDDNEINLEIENEVLKDAGFLVEMAYDGSIAVEKVKQSKPGYYDLILMDIQMPVMDGYHATRAIRSIEDPALSGIPIIAVSANAFEEDKIKAIESGMNAHLAKPLDTARLFKLLKKFLRNSIVQGQTSED